MTAQHPTDWRALCAELVTAWLEGRDIAGPMNRARAALAQPGALANEEVAELAYALRADAECAEVEHYDLCNMTAEQMRRAADLLERLSQPEPNVPTDEHITSIAKAVQECARAWAPNARLLGNVRAEDIDDLCNAVLTRWGRPAIKPIPVSERLPGPEDCDAEGRCWYWDPEEENEHWDFMPRCSGPTVAWTHWLPHWALPMPGQE